MSNFKDYCVRVLGKIHPKATFLSVRNYQNNYGEYSNFSVVFHANYLRVVRDAQKIVKIASCPKSKNFGTAEFNRAKQELLESFDYTLSGHNPLYTCHGVYSEIIGSNGKPIPGIKLHDKQGIVHLNALKVRKTILVPGTYSKTNSMPKTIAKRYLRGLTSLGDWVQFKLAPKKFDSLKVGGLVIKGSK